MPKVVVTLDAEEAEELYRYMEHQYLSPNKYPALSRLWTKISVALRKQEQLLAATYK